MQNNSFKQLLIWQKSIELVELIYIIVRQLPSEEKFILTSQMLRAVISIPSNIAEGFGRRHKKEKQQFFTISYSSSMELETQLIIVNKIYPKVNITSAELLNIEIQKMLNSYISQIEVRSQN